MSAEEQTEEYKRIQRSKYQKRRRTEPSGTSTSKSRINSDARLAQQLFNEEIQRISGRVPDGRSMGGSRVNQRQPRAASGMAFNSNYQDVGYTQSLLYQQAANDYTSSSSSSSSSSVQDPHMTLMTRDIDENDYSLLLQLEDVKSKDKGATELELSMLPCFVFKSMKAVVPTLAKPSSSRNEVILIDCEEEMTKVLLR
jgi:hypothetical protein